MKAVFFFVATLLLAPVVFADDLSRLESVIPEFHQVSEGIYRGGHPTQAGLAELARMGIKTDLNLENSSAVALETEQATQLGLVVISKPMSMFWAPSDSLANEILAVLADPSNRPIFIHCTYGQDRTGLMVGLHRVLAEGWRPADAYQEMLNYNFKSHLLFKLDGYFKERTGFSD